MLDIESASVMDVLNDVKRELNDKGVKRYSASKENEIQQILNEYSDKLDIPDEYQEPDQLKEIITDDIPTAIHFSKSISVEKWLDELDEASSFLALTADSIIDEIERNSVCFSDEINEEFPVNSDEEPDFSKIYSWSYVQKITPCVTKEEYDDIAKAWKDGKITNDVVDNTLFTPTQEFGEEVQEMLDDKKRFSRIRNHLFNEELDWTYLCGNDASLDDPESIFQAVLNVDIDLISIHGILSECFKRSHMLDEDIIETMLNEVK